MTNLKQKAIFAIVITVGAMLPGLASAKRCQGVSTQWVNTCDSAANGHSCASKAETDFDENEWLKYSEKDCDAIQSALKNKDVRNYVVEMRDMVVETSDAKKLKKFKCSKNSCKAAKKMLSTKSLKKYIKKIAKGSLVAKKRGKVFK